MDSFTILMLIPFFCFFLFMFGLMAAVVFFIIRTGKQRTENVNQGWADFARTYHQNFEKGGVFARPRVTGEYCKRSFVLYIFSVAIPSGRGGTHRTYYTCVTTQVKSDIVLKIERRGLLDNMFGTPEATNINKSFDEVYKASGDISPIETPAILAAIQQNNLNALSIEQGKLLIYVKGFVHRPATLREIYDLACDVTDLVEG